MARNKNEISINQANLAASIEYIRLLEDEKNSLNSIFDIRKKTSLQNQIDYESAKAQQFLLKDKINLLSKVKDKDSDEYKDRARIVAEQKKENKLLEDKIVKQNKNKELIKHYATELSKGLSLQAGWIKNLNESDKIIRQTILNLGMSGKKAENLRGVFEKSAMVVAQMGGSLADIQTVMQGYADETGRARILTAQMVTDIIEIGRGTGLGVEAATQMGAQFELMGFDARNTNKMVQGLVETTERMGLNTTKIFKGVNDNFKRLQTYSFKNGIKGMMEMSVYASKMNVDMNQALNAADVAKTLEGAIDLAAQLQVMGGEFAKTDPFEMLFLSRNDPAKFTEKINQMTKGVVSFRKMADGTFEKFISPADRQRLNAVEKSLGMQTGELTQQALRMVDIQKMRQNMLTSTLSPKDKSLIEGMAVYNKETGNFQVQVAGMAKNISDITESEAKSFISQESLLKKRAKDSQTFEEALQATLASLKTVLLPMLRGFNDVLNVVRPIFEHVIKFLGGINSTFVRIIGGFTAVGILLMGAATMVSKAVFFATGKGLFGGAAGGAIGGATGGLGGAAGGAAQNVGATKAWNKGQIGRSNASGTRNLKTGAGVGLAAVGIGAGIGIAAVGVGQLAKAIKNVDVEKLKQMNVTMAIIGGTMIGMGIAATFAAAPVGAFGLAALGIGAGIGIAAAGIGYMAEGFGKLINSAKGAGTSLLSVGAGIAAMSAGMALFSVGGLGLITFAATLATISKYAKPLGEVGSAFKEINLAMKGSAEDYAAVTNAVAAISGMNSKNNSAFSQLATLLKTPLKVEFADKKVQFVSDITLLIDGQKFMQKVYSAKTSAQSAVDLRTGKAGK